MDNTFKEWALLAYQSPRPEAQGLLGVAVEGIRVEMGSPGFAAPVIAALANVTGRDAPRTNVARSTLERTPERTRTLEAIYRAYTRFISSEVRALVAERGFSLTWAAKEARYLMSSLTQQTPAASDRELYLSAASTVPTFVIDDGQERRLASAAEVASSPKVWTVHAALFRSAESLLREVSTSASVAALTSALGVGGVLPEDGPVVATEVRSDPVLSAAFADKEVSTIVIRRGERRADLAWEAKAQPRRWWQLRPDSSTHPDVLSILQRRGTRGPQLEDVWIPASDIPITGRTTETALRTGSATYLLPDTSLATFIQTAAKRLGQLPSIDRAVAQAILFVSVSDALRLTWGPDLPPESEIALLLDRQLIMAGINPSDEHKPDVGVQPVSG